MSISLGELSRAQLTRRRTAAAKRAFDVVASATLLVALLPFIVIMAVVLGITYRAWPFFTQERVGKNGEVFGFIKLRTLPAKAPAYADKYTIQEIKLPLIARVMRSKHLDELPQLLLVLTGKMSLVGPRPEMPYLHETGDPEFAEMRTSVRPGCAGLWQVSEHQHLMIWEAPIYDMAYIKHPSLGFDLWILMRTLLFMLHVRPAVSFADVPRRFLPPVRFELQHGFASTLDLTDAKAIDGALLSA